MMDPICCFCMKPYNVHEGEQCLWCGDLTCPICISEDGLCPDCFKKEGEEWKAETAHLGSISTAIMHPAYQRIIGMGPQVIPLILAQMQREPGHWFWALHAITQANPVPSESEGKINEMTAAWLEWGHAEGFLP